MKLIRFCIIAAFIAFAGATTEPTSFLDEFLPQVADYVQITPNGHRSSVHGRSDSFEQGVEEFVKSHDATFNLPLVGSTVTVGGRHLDNDQIDVQVKFDGGVPEARKSKLKKIFIPIFIFILIKAMVLIPLALGILAIKTWNALQLSFVSFVVAVAMGVWSICKKVAGDEAHPQIIAHNPWEAAAYAQNYIARSLDAGDAQQMAYSAYLQ